MLDRLFSQSLQVKFFLGTLLLVSIGLPVLMLNVFQVLNQYLSHYTEQDIQQRTRILAMAMMVGPAAHHANDMEQLLQEVSSMHGYCYLTVRNAAGKLLSGVGHMPDASDAGASVEHDGCYQGTVPLFHDGKPFGTLYYGANTRFIELLELKLRGKLLILAALWLSVGAIVYYLMVRRLVKPLQALTLASDSMAHGNLNTPMPQGLPRDEVGQLAASFGDMAAALRERVESQQGYAHALYSEQARLNALVSILPVGICFVDPARHVQYINIECRRLWGLSESEDYIGRDDTDLIAHARDQLEASDAFTHNVGEALKVYGISQPFDTTLRNGRTIRSRSCVVPDATGDRYIGRIWMFEDVTQERARLHEAEARADRDVLTGLHNRRRFEEDLQRQFAQSHRNDCRLSLLYFDLDDFKDVNDKYGHDAGDKVLRSVAQALTLQSRRNEGLYRVGGDEFAILVVNQELRQIEALAQRAMSTIAQLHFEFDGDPVTMRCSMGIAIDDSEKHLGNAMVLLQQADAAMYRAKRTGKSGWHVFDPGGD